LSARIDEAGRVATILGDTQVTFNGVASPLLSVQGEEIVAVVPYEAAGSASQKVVVTYRDGSETVMLNAVPVSPGIFPIPDPVAAGSVLTFYATGEGQLNPTGVTGQIPRDPFPVPVAPVAVSIDQTPVELLYAGAYEDTIGAIRIMVRVPDSLAPGQHILTLTIGDVSTSGQFVVKNN